MSKEMGVILLGIVTIATPYLGIPGSWKTAALVCLGALITLLGFLLRGESLSRGRILASEHHPFKETGGIVPEDND